tara:strand:- start:92 stop:877 length:786 start_codon:yes stop_codon:yes gene_type:complete
MTEFLQTKISGHCVHLVLNNPEKRNAVNLAMWRGLYKKFKAFADDSRIRVVIISGAGDKAFSAGADISEFAMVRATLKDRQNYEGAVQNAFKALRDLPQITIAMIDGVTIGGGAEIAMECDILVASERSRFGITPAKLGIGYNATDLERLVKHLGAKAALEILATGKLYSATEALNLGWVRSVVAADELENEVFSLAGTIADNAPLTVKAAKLMVKEVLKPPEKRDHKYCTALVDACYESADCNEGQKAFSEKRKPVFRGT